MSGHLNIKLLDKAVKSFEIHLSSLFLSAFKIVVEHGFEIFSHRNVNGYDWNISLICYLYYENIWKICNKNKKIQLLLSNDSPVL